MAGGTTAHKGELKKKWNNYTDPATGTVSNIVRGDLAPNPGHSVDNGDWTWAKDLHRAWYLPTLMDALGSAKSVHSPCDPKTKRNNDTEAAYATKRDRTGWGVRPIVKTDANNKWQSDNSLAKYPADGGELAQAHCDRRAQSYAFCLGGDLLLPESLVITTRNVAGTSQRKNGLSYSEAPEKNSKGKQQYYDKGRKSYQAKYFAACSQSWQTQGGWDWQATNLQSKGTWGSGEAYKNDQHYNKLAKQGTPGSFAGHYLLAGLDASQGQFGRADGSVVQGSDSDLTAAVVKHMAAEGGTLTQQTGAIQRPSTF